MSAEEASCKTAPVDEEEESPMMFKCNLPPTVLNVLANQPSSAVHGPGVRSHSIRTSGSGRLPVLPAGLTVFVDPQREAVRQSAGSSSASIPALSRLSRMDLTSPNLANVHSFQSQYFTQASPSAPFVNPSFGGIALPSPSSNLLFPPTQNSNTTTRHHHHHPLLNRYF